MGEPRGNSKWMKRLSNQERRNWLWRLSRKWKSYHALAADVIGKQLVRSGTSIGANYRAACRAKSSADMINKMKIVEEESDETEYWLEILAEAGLSLKIKLPTFTKKQMKFSR